MYIILFSLTAEHSLNGIYLFFFSFFLNESKKIFYTEKQTRMKPENENDIMAAPLFDPIQQEK